jgi:hypothetical protein
VDDGCRPTSRTAHTWSRLAHDRGGQVRRRPRRRATAYGRSTVGVGTHPRRRCAGTATPGSTRAAPACGRGTALLRAMGLDDLPS